MTGNEKDHEHQAVDEECHESMQRISRPPPFEVLGSSTPHLLGGVLHTRALDGESSSCLHVFMSSCFQCFD